MHLAQRLALDVLAHAVQLVAGRPPQQQAPPVLRVRAALREEPVERDEPRVDDERLRLALHDLDAGEAERILDRQPNRLERVPPARNRAQLVAAGEPATADAVRARRGARRGGPAAHGRRASAAARARSTSTSSSTARRHPRRRRGPRRAGARAAAASESRTQADSDADREQEPHRDRIQRA